MFFIFLFYLIRKETKESRLSENFFKTTVLFFPRNRNSSFQENWILILRFLSTSYLHKSEPCFVSKFPEGHSFLRFKKIFLIHNANFEFLRAFIEYLEFSAVLLWTLETCQAAGWLCILYLPRQARYNALNMHETL